MESNLKQMMMEYTSETVRIKTSIYMVGGSANIEVRVDMYTVVGADSHTGIRKK